MNPAQPNEFTFFDFIKITLDLTKIEHQACLDILTTLEILYENFDQFALLRKLINDSKQLHTNITLVLTDRHELTTGGQWDVVDRTIKIRIPIVTNNESLYDFAYVLIFEMCNSVNSYFSKSYDVQWCSFNTSNTPEFYAFVTELAEYNTCLHAQQVLMELQLQANNLLSVNYNQLLLANSSIFENIIKIFSRYTLEKYSDTFAEHWHDTNSQRSIALDLKHTASHTDGYRIHSITLQHIMNTPLLESSIDDDKITDEDSITEAETEKLLNSIYDEVILQLKNNTFNKEELTKKHSVALTTAATDPMNYVDYYDLYQIFQGNGNKLSIPELSYIFNIMDIIVNMTKNPQQLTKCSTEERELIYLAFNLVKDLHICAKLSDFESTVSKYLARLKNIQSIVDKSIVEKYQNSLFALSLDSFKSVTTGEIIKCLNCYDSSQPPATMLDLLTTAVNIKSLWRHQSEMILFSSTIVGQYKKKAWALVEYKQSNKKSSNIRLVC